MIHRVENKRCILDSKQIEIFSDFTMTYIISILSSVNNHLTRRENSTQSLHVYPFFLL